MNIDSRSADIMAEKLQDPNVRERIQSHPEKEISKLAQESKNDADKLHTPTDKANDRLWLIIVSTFAIVLLAASVGLIYGSVQDGVRVQEGPILAMFTSVVGFLAGLITPGPMKH